MNNLRSTTITTLDVAEMMEIEHWKLRILADYFGVSIEYFLE